MVIQEFLHACIVVFVKCPAEFEPSSVQVNFVLSPNLNMRQVTLNGVIEVTMNNFPHGILLNINLSTRFDKYYDISNYSDVPLLVLASMAIATASKKESLPFMLLDAVSMLATWFSMLETFVLIRLNIDNTK